MSDVVVRIPVESWSITELTKETYCCCFQPVQIWEDDVEVEIFLPTAIGSKEMAKDAAISAVPLLEEELAWLQMNKGELGKALEWAKERAEEWIWDDPDFVELSDNEGYVELDGQTVCVPISDEAFLNSLFLWSVVFEQVDGAGSFKMSIELGNKPDYFAGHRIHMDIDEHKNFVNQGL
ncbi:DUF2262 domain-containing protein [Paenibacillus sp. sgz500992]|uniref:DUF2262 domain-containing protein n=1 Tax=Paenibacillus sp. sgz500992 TaxID=3242476 RepID=UPI0036D42A5C